MLFYCQRPEIFSPGAVTICFLIRSTVDTLFCLREDQAHLKSLYHALMNRIYPLLGALLLLGNMALAGTLNGHITDEKGTALPFSTVFVQGTTIGTNANATGDYSLSLAPGTYKVVAQFIGYEQTSFNVTITGNEAVSHDFRLKEQSLRMKEVVVKATDEDPAYRIIRKAISRRAFHEKQIKSFQSAVYLKGVLRMREIGDRVLGIKVDKADKKAMSGSGNDSTGKGVLYLVEQMSDYYSQAPDKERTIIHSVRESGDPNGFGTSSLPAVISFYSNNVDVSPQLAPRGFVSPIANGAIIYYKYKLLGEFTESGHVVYKIQVTPRRAYEPLFTGTIYIMDDDWAIHSLDLSSYRRQGLEFLDSMRLTQLYLPLRKDVWVIKSQVLHPVIGIFGLKAAGDFVTVYDRQKVNEPIPDSIFGGRVTSIYDADANKRDTTYWNEARLMPLQNDEVRDYTYKDSLYTRQQSPGYRDSVRRRRNKISPANVLWGGVSHTGKEGKWSMNTNALLTLTNYNTVEGLNLAPKATFSIPLDSNSSLRARTAVRYGFSNTHFNAIGALTYTRNSKSWGGRNWSLGVEGGKYVFQFNRENPISPLYNTIATLLYRENFLKIYERWQLGLNYRQSLGNGFSWKAGVDYQQRLPLENTTDFTWAGKSTGGFTDNTPKELTGLGWSKHNAVLARASVSFQPGVTYVQYPDKKRPRYSSWPVFTLEYEKGIPDLLDSKVDFDKWRFNIEDDFTMDLLGSFAYNISAGGFLNDKSVSLPDMKHLLGNQVYAASPYLSSFQLAPYYRFSNTASLYGEAHVEWNLQGLITNKIPLLRQARWYLVAGNNTFYVDKDQYYTEAFLGVDNLGVEFVRFLRVDFVKGWDSFKEQYTGIRIGIKPTGFVNFRPNQRDTEW